MDASRIFRRWNEGRNCVHVSGENNSRIRMARMSSVDVEAIAFHRNLSGLIADAAELSIEIISDSRFIARDRFDVDQLPRKRDSVHAGKNSKLASGLRCRPFPRRWRLASLDGRDGPETLTPALRLCNLDT